ncbi:glycogen biosynthesis protein GlgD [Sutcliffiella cohnii]|uniref:Glycogen biosynthesis protein GlgD n=1 Tax=Sutcliffiella cohnii TaxID=33932 RepID=A0A223KUA5_9BACI|nr:MULTISPECIES: glycogen biosynthesis protein GlgD [Sutcliffiella]AST92934.1 glycogen biosynthesis protein GlgD [Sutcliffiella cohnii]MED4016103.1 glycogen biosynthesis protein GlgD [Sutcliffiella cohnii]WBL14196.1 glycogen biosynthesis protein GlgD [Sutcliffiella sp. NC1]
MKKRSKQNNPEQKTKNGVNNKVEAAADYNVVKDVKEKNSKKAQPVRSDHHNGH